MKGGIGIFILSLLIQFPAVKVFAESSSLSLSNILTIALAHNPTLLESAKDVKIALARKDQNQADFFLPEFSALADYNLTGASNLSSGWSLGFNASKTLFNGFSLANDLSSAENNLALAEQKYTEAFRNVRFQALTNYFSYLLLKETVSSCQAAMAQYESNYLFIKAQYDRGMTDGIVLMDARSDFEDSVSRSLKANRDLEQGRMKLFTFLGFSDSGQFITGSFLDMTNYVSTAAAQTNLFEKALSNSSSYSVILNSIFIAENSLTTLRLQALPSVNGNFSYKLGLSDTTSIQSSWNAGISLSLDLDQFLPVSRKAAEIQELEQTLERLNIEKLQKQSDIRQTLSNLITAIGYNARVLQNRKDNLDIAEQTLSRARTRYRLGIAAVSEILESEAYWHNSRLEYYNALSDYHISLFYLDSLTEEIL